MNERNFVVVGICGNEHNWLSLEKACEAMETTAGEYTKAKYLILEQKRM